MASAHIITFSISGPLSFHEEVCGNSKNKNKNTVKTHKSPLEIKLRTGESDRHGNNVDTGRSPGAKSAHNTHKHDIFKYLSFTGDVCVVVSGGRPLASNTRDLSVSRLP